MKQTVPYESVVVTIREAAQILGRSEPAIRAMVARGQLGSVLLGSRRFVPREAINTFLRGAVIH